jgi:copper(I)-binding protein
VRAAETRAWVGLVGVFATAPGCAPDTGPTRRAAGAIGVSSAVVVAPAPGAPAAVYASFANGTGRADSLTGLSSPIADSATLHTQESRGAMVVMRPVAAVAIPAGGALALAPGGLHGMLAGLHGALTPGDSVSLTFRFAAASPVTVTARVIGYAELGRRVGHADHEDH